MVHGFSNISRHSCSHPIQSFSSSRKPSTTLVLIPFFLPSRLFIFSLSLLEGTHISLVTYLTAVHYSATTLYRAALSLTNSASPSRTLSPRLQCPIPNSSPIKSYWYALVNYNLFSHHSSSFRNDYLHSVILESRTYFSSGSLTPFLSLLSLSLADQPLKQPLRL